MLSSVGVLPILIILRLSFVGALDVPFNMF